VSFLKAELGICGITELIDFLAAPPNGAVFLFLALFELI
jgi:hypothetical protein